MTIECGRMTVSRESMKKRSYWEETIPENRRKVILHITSKHFLYSHWHRLHIIRLCLSLLAFQVVLMAKNLPVNARDKRDSRPTWIESDLCLLSGLGRSPEGGNSNPFQYSCLGNPMDGGAWWATVHGVAKSRTRPSN